MMHLRKIGVQKNEMPKQGGVILLSPTSVVLYIVFLEFMSELRVKRMNQSNQAIAMGV